MKLNIFRNARFNEKKAESPFEYVDEWRSSGG